jgi:hypothetical protein
MVSLHSSVVRTASELPSVAHLLHSSVRIAAEVRIEHLFLNGRLDAFQLRV